MFSINSVRFDPSTLSVNYIGNAVADGSTVVSVLYFIKFYNIFYREHARTNWSRISRTTANIHF